MLMTRWEPSTLWNGLRQFQKEMNRLFGSNGLEEGGRLGLALAYPAVNVWEDGEAVYAEAELPGMNLDDLEIYVTGNQLAIKGERKQPPVEKGYWHRQERGFGSFALNSRPPRIGRNPKSGDKVMVPEKRVPHFKPGKQLRERVDAMVGQPIIED